ncbi:MAG: glycosyltransferase family 4 protein [Plectolyngbya sp. WJT66-NPBG17]|jgi:glycosyltransferase involved in cell wall biosynthesis|nr:glycosyltransferase family 4 protein [Plectolyngbya sp. WJT66-NPBG17]
MARRGTAVSAPSGSMLPAEPPPALVQLSILTQFFPPDFAATGQLIEELSRNLQPEGLAVRVFTGQPGYAFSKAEAPTIERSDQLFVRRSRTAQLLPSRIRGKALNGLMFVARSALYLMRSHNRGDLLMVTTAPPFLPILGFLANWLFGTPYICLLYDLYPDVAVELKIKAADHWIVRAWDFVNRCVWKRSTRIIVLSSSMKARIVAKCPEVADRIAIIHSWADPDSIVPIPKQENWFAQEHDLVDKFTVLYSGNMGRCHDIETIVAAAQELRDDPVEFLIIGDGAQRERLIEKLDRLDLHNFKFLPYQDKANLPYSLTACDLSLVSVKPGMEGIVAPSKLYSALAASRPIAAICEEHSYLRSLISDAGCGACFDNGDGVGLANFIRGLVSSPALVERMGRSGRRYMKAHFTPEIVARQYANVMYEAVLSCDDLMYSLPSVASEA